MTCRYRCASLLVMATLSSSCVTCELPTAEEHRKSGACRSVFDQAAKAADPPRLSRSAREY